MYVHTETEACRSYVDEITRKKIELRSVFQVIVKRQIKLKINTRSGDIIS